MSKYLTVVALWTDDDQTDQITEAVRGFACEEGAGGIGTFTPDMVTQQLRRDVALVAEEFESVAWWRPAAAGGHSSTPDASARA